MKEIKGQSKSELIKTLNEKRSAFQAFKYELSGGKSKDVKKGRNLRKDIARVMTELSMLSKTQAPKAKVAKEVAADKKVVKKAKAKIAKK